MKLSAKTGRFLKAGRQIWVLLLLCAVMLVLFSVFANQGSDFTRAASRKVGKILDRRVEQLETYMREAMAQPHDQWLDLDRLPEDMVVYRYVYDSLQSWCHQFAIDNDDISNRLIIKRFYDIRHDLESPLLAVDGSWRFLNIGPDWFMARKLDNGLDCKVIGGLRVKSPAGAAGHNGVSRHLRLSDRFALYPLAYDGGSPVSVRGRPMMKILQEDARVLPLMPTPSLAWIAVGLVILGMMLYLHRHRSVRGLAVTLSAILFVLGLFFAVGRRLGNSSPIFSPVIFAQGGLLYSLGALLLLHTAIFLTSCCLYMAGPALLLRLQRGRRKLKAAFAGLFLLAAFVLILCYIHFTAIDVVMNSGITLELYKINSLDRYTVFTYLSYITLLMSLPLLLQLARPLARQYLHLRYDIFSRFWRTVFCVCCSLYFLLMSSVYGFRRETGNMDIWANELSIDRDMGFELQLRNVEGYIASDPLVPKLAANPGYRYLMLRRISENYLGKLSRDYEVMMQVYADKKPDPVGIRLFNDRIRSGSPIAPGSHFYYTRTPVGRARYTGMFVYYVPGSGVIRILVGLDSKAEKAGRGYAAIFGAPAAGAAALPPLYSYGKYIAGKLVAFNGSYAYPTLLSEEMSPAEAAGKPEIRFFDRYVHFISRISEEEVIVISRSRNDYMRYLVSASLIALLAYMGVSLPDLRRRRKSKFDKNYFRSRINTVLFFSLIATLVVMAVISVLFVHRRNNAHIETVMTGKISTIQSLVEAGCSHFRTVSEFGGGGFPIVLRDISDHTRSDITLYTVGGKMFRSTAPEVFERMLQPARMDQDAYRHLMYRHSRYYIHREKVGGQSFYCMYAPVFNGEGRMLAILGAPFTDGGLEYKNDAVSHSVFIITLFFILLIMASLLTARVIDKMFEPLSAMGEKMISARTAGLEYIIYDREDEISSVVRAYNLMVHDLSESTKQLTAAERDKAWREMARQVAHEIKTPLTPIKLQIQRIIRLRRRQSPNWEETFDAILPTIIGSIDQLADAADDFSTFAKLYSEEYRLIDIDRMAAEVLSLFDGKEQIRFEHIGLEGALVMGPKPQLYRVFVNLVTNAVQAIETAARDGGRKGLVRLSVRNGSEDGYYDVVFEDNGPGVKDEDRNRLFVPNFTTKNSGSGLGLAICKNILDVCGGGIAYSRSFSLQGACFTVHLPKYQGPEGGTPAVT